MGWEAEVAVRMEMLGVLRQLAGAPMVIVEGEPATVAEALELLLRAQPGLRAQIERCAVALGDRMLRRTDTLPPDATLALLPPVAGG